MLNLLAEYQETAAKFITKPSNCIKSIMQSNEILTLLHCMYSKPISIEEDCNYKTFKAVDWQHELHPEATSQEKRIIFQIIKNDHLILLCEPAQRCIFLKCSRTNGGMIEFIISSVGLKSN